MQDDINLTLDQVAKCYVELLTRLLAGQNHSHKSICIPTNDGRYLNFRQGDVKKILLALVPAQMYRRYMQLFRDLEWIVCKAGRFTNIQWIGDKSVRVVTIDEIKYRTIKKLMEMESEVCNGKI